LVSRAQFYREVNSNRLRVVKRGRRTYIVRSDALAWIEAQRQTEGQEK